jgi:hypothetical protein
VRSRLPHTVYIYLISLVATCRLDEKVVVNIGGTYCAVVKRYSTADIQTPSCRSYITSRPNLNLNSSSRFPPPTTVTHPYHSTRSGIYTNVTLSHAMRGTSLSSKLFFPRTKEDQRERLFWGVSLSPFFLLRWFGFDCKPLESHMSSLLTVVLSHRMNALIDKYPHHDQLRRNHHSCYSITGSNTVPVFLRRSICTLTRLLHSSAACTLETKTSLPA